MMAAPERRSSEDAGQAAIDAALQDANDSLPDAARDTLPQTRVRNDVGAVERRAEHGGVCDFSAEATPDAAVDHRRDGILAERVRIGRDRERRTARQPDARMIARTGI